MEAKKQNTSLAERIVAAARAELGVREQGHNQGPDVRRFWSAVSGGAWFYGNNSAWCAAFVSYCVRCASLDAAPEVSRRFRFASVRAMLHSCERYATRMTPATARAGDIVIYLPWLSHCGIVEARTGNGLFTIEGNTNAKGGREGNGVWRKHRPDETIGSVWRL